MRHKDSEILRKAAGVGVDYSGPVISDESFWKIILANHKDIAVTKKLELDSKGSEDILKWLQQKDTCDNEYAGEIHRRLDWKYVYRDFAQIPSKITVTELKRYFNLNNDEENSQPEYRNIIIKKPAFMEEKKGLTPAEKGTAMHFAMQHLDFHNEDISGQIEIMVKKELLTEIQAKSIDIRKISVFINSSIGKRMLKSSKMHREVPFNIELDYKEIYPQLTDVTGYQDKILLQGVIDCYFEEDDNLVLIDYKTDYVPNGDIEVMKEKYKLQISYYSRALEMLTSKQVKERYIYLFSTGDIVKM